MSSTYPSKMPTPIGGQWHYLMKYLKILDLKMKDQMSGHENAGQQKHDRKLVDKLPKASTQSN